MKVAVLAGGAGRRLAEETESQPKAMVGIGGIPILHHVMNHYAHAGHREFVIALGYRGDVIMNYVERSQLTDRWNVELVDTGARPDTGGRLKRLAPHLPSSTFLMTWSDGLSNVDLDALVAFHHRHGRLVTVTAVRPPARFGHMDIDDRGRVTNFVEKPERADEWVNGAFFVCEPGIFDYLDGDDSSFERDALVNLAKDDELMAFRHHGFWQCMDTIHDRRILEDLWAGGSAPWIDES